jgi:hypothetical protein
MDVWFGIAACLVGLASCFYGYPLFRMLLVLSGLIYGYVLGQSFVPASHPWLALGIGLGAAVVLAVLAYPLWSISVVVIGAVLGFMTCSFLGIAMSASQGTVILVGFLGAAAAGFLFYRTRDFLVMLATAGNGAVQVVYGLGWLFPSLTFGRGQTNFLALVAIVVLGGCGFAVQYGMFKDRDTYSR